MSPAARAAASKPHASLALRMALRTERRSAAPHASRASLSAPGTSERSGDSGHALGLAVRAGSRQAGSPALPPSS